MADRIDTAVERTKLAALEGHTPGPWESFKGPQTNNWMAAIYGPAGDYDALLVALCDQNAAHTKDVHLIAAAPDLKATLATALDEIDRMREALTFYADAGKYVAPFTGGQGDLYFDGGDLARAVLNGDANHE